MFHFRLPVRMEPATIYIYIYIHTHTHTHIHRHTHTHTAFRVFGDSQFVFVSYKYLSQAVRPLLRLISLFVLQLEVTAFKMSFLKIGNNYKEKMKAKME